MGRKEKAEAEVHYLYASFLYYDDGDAIIFDSVMEVTRISIPAILEAIKDSTGGKDAKLLGLIPLSREEMIEYEKYMNGLAKEKAVRFKPKGRIC